MARITMRSGVCAGSSPSSRVTPASSTSFCRRRKRCSRRLPSMAASMAPTMGSRRGPGSLQPRARASGKTSRKARPAKGGMTPPMATESSQTSSKAMPSAMARSQWPVAQPAIMPSASGRSTRPTMQEKRAAPTRTKKNSREFQPAADQKRGSWGAFTACVGTARKSMAVPREARVRRVAMSSLESATWG